MEDSDLKAIKLLLDKACNISEESPRVLENEKDLAS